MDSTLSASDLNTLRNIAVLCPYYDGIAVYDARSILLAYNIPVGNNDCEITTIPQQNSKSFQRLKFEEKRSDLIIYPNPFNTELNIDYEIEATEKGNIQIIDVLGRTALDIELKEGANHRINTKGLKKGMYFFNFMVNNEIVKQGKILKE